jgi:tRNA (guanine-N7-)-methyltransferase
MYSMKLNLPDPCPLEGVLLEDQSFFFQPPKVFSLPPKEFQPINPSKLFIQTQPIYLEFCSGNGTWIAEKAQQSPEINWIAVEKCFERARKIWLRMQKTGLTNLFVVCAEAELFTRTHLQTSSIEKIYINFPDPWPKNKHAKHRLFKLPFIEEVCRILTPQGELMVVTDDVAYSQQINRVLSQAHALVSTFKDPYYTTEMEEYGTSFFDALWRSQGKSIHYMHYRKGE